MLGRKYAVICFHRTPAVCYGYFCSEIGDRLSRKLVDRARRGRRIRASETYCRIVGADREPACLCLYLQRQSRRVAGIVLRNIDDQPDTLFAEIYGITKIGSDRFAVVRAFNRNAHCRRFIYVIFRRCLRYGHTVADENAEMFQHRGIFRRSRHRPRQFVCCDDRSRLVLQINFALNRLADLRFFQRIIDDISDIILPRSKSSE